MLKNHSKTRDMTSGNIVKHLMAYSVPISIGSMFQLLYNMVDTIIVGKHLGTQALAAVGSTGLIINVVVNFFMGFAVGAGVLIGHCFGAKDKYALKEAIQTTITFTLILSLVFTVLGFILTGPILHLVQTPNDVFNDAFKYLRIYFIGISGLLLYSIGSEILRAVGNSILPLRFLVVSSVINVELDIVFIVFLKAGVEGAAWATVISQMLSAEFVLITLTKTKEIYKIDWKRLHINKEQLKRILSVGMPSGVQSIITGAANLVAQTYVNALGSSVVAAWGCFNKVFNLALLPTNSLGNATTNFLSQNIGAKQFDRIKKGITYSNILNVGISIIITVPMYIFAEPLIGMYSTDKAVIKYGAIFMRCIILSVIYYSFGNNFSSTLIALGDSMAPSIIKIVFYVFVRVGCLYAFVTFIGLTPQVISAAFPISWAFGTAALYIYYLKEWKKPIAQGKLNEENHYQGLVHLHMQNALNMIRSINGIKEI